ncbi:MAG: NAD-dependent epimerase/dehydratase family protein [Actinomycetota bacterium]
MISLVTGACGFIGSHMVETLARAGHEVIAADLPAALAAAPSDRSRFPEVCAAAGARLVPLDLTDPITMRPAVEGAEIVFHIAAVFDYTAPEHVLQRVNVDGTRALLDALLAAGTCRRFVNWGAGGIYGLPDPRTPVFSEDSPARPGNAYLVSKWDQERLAHSYRERGLGVTSVRPVSPYGPRAAYGSGQLLLGLAERSRPVAFSNLTGNIPMEHVEDVCSAALHLAVHPAADGEAYNVTADGDMDAVRLARIVADEMGSEPLILPPVPLRALRKVLSGAARIGAVAARRKGARPLLEYDQVQYFGRDWRYSNAKLKDTGFRFAWPEPEPGIRATLRWYLDNVWLRPARARAAARG